MKSIIFGTNHSLSAKPCLDILLNHVAIEQVEYTKLLGVTLHSTEEVNCFHCRSTMINHLGLTT